MKKFVVTGGSGFIGSNLVKFLLSKNHFVINIDKLSYSSNPLNLKEINKNKNYRFFKQDINNQTQIYNILNRFKPILFALPYPILAPVKIHSTLLNSFSIFSLILESLEFSINKTLISLSIEFRQFFIFSPLLKDVIITVISLTDII